MNHSTRLFSIFAVLTLAAGCSAPATAPEEAVASSTAALSSAGTGWALVGDNGALGSPYTYTTGTAITSTRYSEGEYGVTFSGIALTSSSIAHVVAYGSAPHCKMLFQPLGGGAETSVYVNCYMPTGSPADSSFVVFLDTQPVVGASLITYGGTSPTVVYSSNSSGQPNSVTWSPLDEQYSVTLPGITFYDAGVHVTAYGGNADRCKVVGWSTGSVVVKCFDPTGAAVAAGFGLSYTQDGLVSWGAGGHSWIDDGVANPSYSSAWSAVACDSDAEFSAIAVGADVEVSLTSSYFEYGGVFPMVTAYGSDATYCNVMQWSETPASSAADIRFTTNVVVRCFNAAATEIKASSTAFDISISNSSMPAPC
jgi:hypothetical protein